jgi:hypothetical protein
MACGAQTLKIILVAPIAALIHRNNVVDVRRDFRAAGLQALLTNVQIARENELAQVLPGTGVTALFGGRPLTGD